MMLKINRKIEYALIALKHMRGKQPGALSTAGEISRLYGVPFDVTSRALQTLAQKGILKSEQGVHGGYQITKDLRKFSMYELIEYFLGPVGIAKCLHSEDENHCEIRKQCNIVSPMQILNRKLMEFYKNLSVAEILDPPKSSPVQFSNLHELTQSEFLHK